ncbi:Amino-transferase class IV [Candidatus Anstonella stagnisolia]|nr:Amino-transferase class IV [Candidatus Anstonella stagnisolia]
MALSDRIPLIEGVRDGMLFRTSEGRVAHELNLQMKINDPDAKTTKNDLAEARNMANIICAVNVGEERFGMYPETAMVPFTFTLSLNKHAKIGIASETAKYGGKTVFDGLKIVPGLCIPHPADNAKRQEDGAIALGVHYDHSPAQMVYVMALMPLVAGYAEVWPVLPNGNPASIVYSRLGTYAILDTTVGIGKDHYVQTTNQLIPMGLYFDERKMGESGVNVFACFTGETASPSPESRAKASAGYMHWGRFRAMTSNMPNVAETILINDSYVERHGVINKEEYVKEGTSDTFVIIKNGRIICPPLETGRLNGTTVRMLQKIAEKRRIPFKVENVTFEDVIRADGAGCFGNAVGGLPVGTVFARASDASQRGAPEPATKINVDIFGRDTLLWGYELNTGRSPIWGIINAEFKAALTDPEYALCIRSILVPNGIEIMNMFREVVTNDLRRGKEVIRIMPNVLRDGAELVSDKVLYPDIKTEKPNIRWQEAFRKRVPVATLDSMNRMLVASKR